ncbi:relaxase/mobilization nuclease domain-containing protein, partial [Shigella flexneri]|nr:relaxase/mobilization nuclease domain-containing protein [Shigella flexneri]
MNDRLASRENWHILEPPKERQTETEKELIAKNEYSYMDDLRERINKSLQDVSVSSYENVWPLSDRITPLSDKRSLN